MENQNTNANVWDVWAPRPLARVADEAPQPGPEPPIEPSAPEEPPFVPPEQAEAPEPAPSPPPEVDEPEPTEPVHETIAGPSPKKRGSGWRRPAIFGSAAVIVLLIVVWLVGNLRLANFQLGGVQLPTHLSSAQLSSTIAAKASGYKLTIAYPNKSQKSYNLKAMGLGVDTPGTVASFHHARSQPKNWLAWWRPIPVQLKTKVDSNALNNFVSSHATVIAQPAKDAQLTLAAGKVKVVSSAAGKEYGLVKPLSTLIKQASQLQTKAVHLETLALHPALEAADLSSSKAKLEKTLGQKISFTLGGQVITPTPSDIANWLDIAPDKKARTANITVNSGKVASYIDSIAAGYIQPPKAQVNVTKHGKISVLAAGQNGTDVTNKADIATNISKNLLNDQGMQLDLTVSHAPYKTITAGDWPKWIEVDLTNMRLYAYEKNKLVDTFLISAGRPDTPTVVGQFKIYSKLASQTMSGPNVDGSSFVQPNVPWVNYFYKDFAIHGNYWRPASYFGHVASSHGCVGLLDNDAAWVYNWAPIGTPVITHY